MHEGLPGAIARPSCHPQPGALGLLAGLYMLSATHPNPASLGLRPVQGYLQATDRVGLDLLLAADSPRCPRLHTAALICLPGCPPAGLDGSLPANPALGVSRTAQNPGATFFPTSGPSSAKPPVTPCVPAPPLCSGVLACHQNFVPAVRFSEIGASGGQGGGGRGWRPEHGSDASVDA